MSENLRLSEEHHRPSEIGKFNPRSVAIVMITKYENWHEGEPQDSTNTDKARGDLALRSIGVAREKGYQVFVADSPQSPAVFRDQLADLGVTIVPRGEEDDRTVSFIRGIEAASVQDGVEAIVITQPEKVSLVDDGISQIARAITEGGADVVVPTREDELFRDTYPSYMYESEVRSNRLSNRILQTHCLLSDGQFLDIFFGVIAFRNNPDMLRSILTTYHFIDDRKRQRGPRRYAGLETSMFPVFEALRQGRNVAGVPVPFRYPEDQRRNEEDPDTIDGFRQKRYAQRQGIIVELIHFVRHVEGDPKSRLQQ